MSSGAVPRRKVVLIVGTVKGVFLYHSDEARQEWRLTGPHLGGWEIFGVCGDPRSSRIFVGTSTFQTGPTIRVSSDLGATWTPVKRDPQMPDDSKAELKHIWQIVPGHPSQPGTWYAGVDDAALFVSRDDGDTWDEVTGLTNHPTRLIWQPGYGGLCLHSIIVDPTNAQRLWVGISAVGVFRTDDGGTTWTLCNNGLPNIAPDFLTEPCGRCVHKLVLDPSRPGALAMQFHGGVYLSDNAGDSWTRVSAGMPHDFGFPMAATPEGGLFVIPLIADQNRVVPDGALKVWRTRDHGRTWRAMTNGLPQKEHYVGVLRDGMTADSLTPAGVYFGTTSGEVYFSSDDGEHWTQLPGALPRITNVKAWVV